MTMQQKEADPVSLRLLSGAWFHEERSKRYRDPKDGVDIVQASIRGRKPRTDLSVSGVFKGQTEDAPPTNNNDPSSQIEDKKEEDDKRSYRSRPTARPRSPDPDPGAQTQTQEPRPRSPNPQDTDSVSSVVTDADLTLLRPGLSISTLSLQSNYTLSGSMMSLFSSGEFGAVAVKGRVLFSLDYDTQREELQVRVCRCEGLVAARKNHSDPYAKAYLLPDKSSHSKKKTTVKRKTLNPVFDQTLKVRALTHLSLCFSIYFPRIMSCLFSLCLPVSLVCLIPVSLMSLPVCLPVSGLSLSCLSSLCLSVSLVCLIPVSLMSLLCLPVSLVCLIPVSLIIMCNYNMVQTH
uniref:C2 domain-containing protein n=1 Tax=Oncorhynchus tshawytscha TaxID=74940 RepID=A0AAZ3PZW8_ONCTS